VENEILSLKRAFADIDIEDVILIDESYSSALHKLLPNKARQPSFFPLRFRESKQFLSRLTERNLDDLGRKYDIPADIADSIDGYAIILNKLFRLVKKRSIYILETSLTEALLANMVLGVELSKKYNKTNQLISVAKFLCQKFNADTKHTRQVASLAEDLFNQLKEYLGLQDSDQLYLLLAAHLHNIGTFVNNRAHHKHTEYVINALNLFRLSEEEIKTIACIARYHRKSLPQKSHYLYNTLPREEQIRIQKLSSILRMANALDSSHRQKVKKVEISSPRSQELVFTVISPENVTLEKVNFMEMKKSFEAVSGNKISLIIKKQS